jgi:hypothetical protein
MFDTLVDERYETQVKCFYRPVFTEELYFGAHTAHDGGSLATYCVGDKLPLKTLYYDYPKNMCIVLDSLNDEYEIALVENGRFSGFISDCLDAPEEITEFYTRMGTKIKTKNRYEVKKYIEENKNEFEKDFEERNFEEIASKWLTPISLEQELGELIECCSFHQHFKDKKLSMKMEHEKILMAIKEFGEKHPIVFSAFMKINNIQF